jgi:hypothetical protein
MDIIGFMKSANINNHKGGTMERRIKLSKTLSCIVSVLMAVMVSCSLCFADIPHSTDSEALAAFSNSMDTELGDNIKASLEEKGLEIDLERGVNIPVLGAKVTVVPLISINSHQMAPTKNSQFLAYINQETSGRFLIFLEIIKSQDDEINSFKIVFPSGRGLFLNLNPFCIYQIGSSHTGISLQDHDDLGNSIIVSDTCETLQIIAMVLASACAIIVNPILCAIAAAIETVYQFLC